MPLAAGTRLGPYEIVAPLGAGGMGEVYRGRDTRLDREVAIKVVRGAVIVTPESRQRFEREARTVASLNHPHICTLYDVGRAPAIGGSGEIDYLVMELVDGESLAQRLAKGALPASDLLRFGIHIADALDRAHRAGVVHRDLKPGNVMLAKAGAKLMDFGLARIHGPKGMAIGSAVPTQDAGDSQPLTAEGAIIGTLQYLAPEQLEGKEADARSDVWALGCVLYEMATGRPAFAGKSQASLVGAIMNTEPAPISGFSPLSPPALDRLVHVCITKDPDERIQTAHDVRLQLEWIRDSGSQPEPPAPIPASRRLRERVAWTLALAGALAVAALLVLRAERSGSMAPRRFSIPAPFGRSLTDWTCALAASPDGTQLAFITGLTSGSDIWLRSLESETPRLVPQTSGAHRQLFWSPDGQYIGFFAFRDGRSCLLKIRTDGGNATTLCDAPSPRGGSWNRRGDVLLAPAAEGPICRTHSGGGTPLPVTTLDSTRGETSHRFPCFLPDDDHFLYAALPRGPEGYTIYVGSLKTGRSRRIMSAESAPIYAPPGALVFLREGQVTAQRFDPRRLVLRGEPVTIGAAATPSDMDAEPVATVSRDGAMFMLRHHRAGQKLVWASRLGVPLDTLQLPFGYWRLKRLSPDGRRACAFNDGYWTIDLARSTPTRVGASPWEQDISMAWSPDSRRIAYTSNASGRVEIYLANADGSGTPELLPTTRAQFKSVLDWSPDGRHLVIGTLEPATEWDIQVVPMTGDRKPMSCVSSPGPDLEARLSPDGRWLAYSSWVRGASVVFLQSFPDGASRVRVSPGWGAQPRWTEAGKALLFQSDQGLTRVGISPGDPPVFGPPRTLFPPPARMTVAEFTADGRMLTSIGDSDDQKDIKAILNWPALLKR